jgi:hypothetical protein
VAEGVPVNVSCEVPPAQIGLTAVIVTLRFDVTVTTALFSKVVHPFAVTCVNVIVAPAGQVAPKLTLLGPMFAIPAALKTKFPDPPLEVDQERLAFGVPVKLMVAEDPGQIEDEEVKVAVGARFTIIVPEALTVPHPPINGIE